MANLIEQIMMQAQGGSAQGQGFGSFAVQGMQLRQNQQQINLRERQIALEAELQPLRVREAQLKLDESELKLNETKRMMSLRESNMKAFDELSELITSNVHEGTAAGIEVNRAIRRTLMRNPSLMEDPRVQSMLKYFNDSMQLEFKDRQLTQQENEMLQPRTSALSPVGKLIAERNQAITMGDTETASFYDAAIQKAVTSTGQTIRTNPDGTIEIISGPMGAGSSVTTATKTRFEQLDATALQTASRARRLLPLLDASNVGPRGMFNRTAEAVLGTIYPDYKVGTSVEAITVARQFKAGLVALLKSDGNIAEPEREAIEDALPQPDKLITASNQEKLKLAATLEDVGQMSRNNAKTRGNPVHPIWLFPSEIKVRLTAGEISETEAEALLDGNMWIFIALARQGAQGE